MILTKFVRWRKWNYKTPNNGLRRRLYYLVTTRKPWYDWGHRLIILVGRDFGGNWSEPKPPTWWYRRIPRRPMWRTGYPRYKFEIIKNYKDFVDRTKDLNEDQLYEWSAINGNQDGQLQFGYMYWGKGFYGLAKDEQRVLCKYIRMWRRLDWWGLRSYLYSQGIHATVHLKKPFTCQVTPPRDSGGYSHWYCDRPKKHKGVHKYKNYEWDPAKTKVEYAPVDSN